MTFESFISGFENVLFYLAVGLLIAGGIFVFLSFVFNFQSLMHALGAGNHDISADHDISVDHDISIDHDISMDHDISIDHDVSIDHGILADHDISMDHDVSVDHEITLDKDFTLDHDVDSDLSAVHADGIRDVTHSSAPIFLILSTYSVMFGILGLSTLKIPSSSIGLRIFRIVIIVISPYLLALVITNVWRRISATTVKPIVRGVQLIGKVGKVFVAVDSKGGMIHVDLGEGLGEQKLPAKSFDFYKRYEREETVRIVAVKNGVYLVDNN
ncbi:MAG: hypothetical protein GPJ50_07295 [Candidatus Heimdallarchaeota archaeon]|nr:hypothetical protein [Candidatus Heimdallarchaeota archaeon]